MHICLTVTNEKKKAMNLKEGKEVYGWFWREEREKEWEKYVIIYFFHK